jgi:hypothetical protein
LIQPKSFPSLKLFNGFFSQSATSRELGFAKRRPFNHEPTQCSCKADAWNQRDKRENILLTG